MRFLNAVAWVLVVWSALAIAIPGLLTATETNAVLYLARLQHLYKVFLWRGAIFVISMLWLIFG